MRYLTVLFVYFLLLTVSCTGKSSSGEVKSSGKNLKVIKLALMIRRADISWYRMQIEGFEEICRENGADYLILDIGVHFNGTYNFPEKPIKY